MGLRDPSDPCRQRPGPDHRGPGRPDLPDDQLPVPRHRPRRQPVRPGGGRQRLHPHHEPDSGCAGGSAQRPRGRRHHGHRSPRHARGRLGPGRPDPRHPQPGRDGRPHRVVRVALRRHLQPLPLHAAEDGHHGHLRRRPRRSRRVARRGAGQHQGLLRRDDPEPEERRVRHRRRGRGGPRQRRAADRRQHRPDAVPDPAAGVGGRHRRAQPDQVHRRSRHLDRRRHRRRGHVRLRRFGPLPEPHRARSELPRPRLLARAGTGRLRHQGPGPAAA